MILKFGLGMRLLAALTLLAFFTSCSKDDTVKPDFLGTWTTSFKDFDDESEERLEKILDFTFTNNTFEITLLTKRENDKEYIFDHTIKGSLAWFDNQMKLVPEALSYKDNETGKVVDLKKDDEKFIEEIQDVFEYPSVTLFYVRKDDKLTFWYKPEAVTLVFQRK